MRSEIIDYLQQFHILLYVPDYRVCYMLMAISAIAFSTFLASKSGLPVLRFYVVLVLTGLSSFIAARIFFEAHHYNPGMNLESMLTGNGTESTGAYTGGILGAFLFLKFFKINYLKAFDAIAPAIALCLFFGRLGCFMDGCCFGKITSLPWGISFPQNSPAYLMQLNQGVIDTSYDHSLPVHPTQVYEMLFGLLLFIILIFSRKLKNTPGLGLVIYFICYAVFRFVIEFLRGDDRGILVGLSLPQIFSILIFFAGQIFVAFVVFKKRTSQKIISV